MNVLHIVPSMNPDHGGVCQGIRNSIPEMKKNGIHCEVLSFDESNAPYLKLDKFKVHALGAGRSLWQYNKKLIPWLTKNLERFDIVIINALWLYHSYASMKSFLRYRSLNNKQPRIYVMPHGMLDPYFQKAKERRFKAFRNNVYWNLVEKKVVNEADGLLFTCQEELLLARDTFPAYNPKKEINVGYGIQEPPLRSSEMKTALKVAVPEWDERPFFLFLGRINPKKGIEQLIRAYLSLEQTLPDLPQLVIAGPADHSYGRNVKNLASSSSKILFPGSLSGHSKWGAFYESGVFILPSHQENFGIAVVEALACSTPVLITKKVNIWDVIHSSEAGVIIDNSEESILDSLKDWLSFSDSHRKNLAQNAHKAYSNFFTVEKSTKQFIQGISCSHTLN